MCSAIGSTLFTDQDAILERWTEYTNSVLNRISAVSDDAIKRLPEIYFRPSWKIKKMIRHVSFDKAPGANAISTEVYYAGGLPMAWKLTEVFQC